MYFVYILASKNNSTIYIGVTNDLHRRLNEHRSGKFDGFTKKYHINKLVYFEKYSEIAIAISREKQLKGWKRSKKNELIMQNNPQWDDLSAYILSNEV